MAGNDDKTIVDQERLFRRVHKDWIVEDSNLQELRPTSQAFQNYPKQNAFSVSIESVLHGHGMDADSVIVDPDLYAIASLNAGFARQQQQTIERHPMPPTDPSHAHVVGDKPDKVKKAFKRAAEWITSQDALRRLKDCDLTQAEKANVNLRHCGM